MEETSLTGNGKHYGKLRRNRPGVELSAPRHLRREGRHKQKEAHHLQGLPKHHQRQGNGGAFGLCRSGRIHPGRHRPCCRRALRAPETSALLQLRAHRHLRNRRAAQLHELPQGHPRNRRGHRSSREPAFRPRRGASQLHGSLMRSHDREGHRGRFGRRVNRAHPRRRRARLRRREHRARIALLIRGIRGVRHAPGK